MGTMLTLFDHCTVPNNKYSAYVLGIITAAFTPLVHGRYESVLRKAPLM
jgi:hypothetical protein